MKPASLARKFVEIEVVLGYVVEQTGDDGFLIHPHPGQGDGGRQAVLDVGPAGLARLASVRFLGVLKRELDHIKVNGLTIAAQVADHWNPRTGLLAAGFDCFEQVVERWHSGA